MWLYFSGRNRSAEHRGLLRAADRLNFVIFRTEEACFDKNLARVVELRGTLEDFLEKILLQTLAIKKREKIRELDDSSNFEI